MSDTVSQFVALYACSVVLSVALFAWFRGRRLWFLRAWFCSAMVGPAAYVFLAHFVLQLLFFDAAGFATSLGYTFLIPPLVGILIKNLMRNPASPPESAWQSRKEIIVALVLVPLAIAGAAIALRLGLWNAVPYAGQESMNESWFIEGRARLFRTFLPPLAFFYAVSVVGLSRLVLRKPTPFHILNGLALGWPVLSTLLVYALPPGLGAEAMALFTALLLLGAIGTSIEQRRWRDGLTALVLNAAWIALCYFYAWEWYGLFGD